MNPENTNTLPIGTVLCNGDRKYRIVKVLGQGGFGITYLAIGEVVVDNVVAEGKFAIKEHFPSAYCERKGAEVTASEDNMSNYDSSKHDFVAEARKLHVFGTKNENIVKVNEVFEENGTAYYVMQYINGESLLSYVRNHGKLSYNEAMKILLPIINAVGFLHKSRINHLDIKPDNIMLHDSLEGMVPVLVDFGLSIHFKRNGDKTSPKNVLGVSEGYSPLEQYAGISEFLPAADIYALVATLLYAMTGTTPKSATELKVSDIRNAFKDRLPDNIIDGICKALNKSYEDRTPSIEVLKADLGLAGPGTATRVIDLDHDKRESKGKKGEGNKKIMLIAGTGAVIGLIIAAFFIFRPSSSEILADESGTVILPDTVSALHPNDTVKPISADNSVAEKNKVLPLQDTEKTIRNSAESGAETGTVSGKPAGGTGKDNTVDSEPVPVKPKNTEEVTNGTLSLGYGTWVGGIRNGKQDGKGKLTFTARHKVDRSSSEEANPGDYFVATYDAGSLISGKLYDSSGNVLKTITP